MITYQTGDILQANTEALVNTVNCVGVMGRGIALQFKNAFPDNFKSYAEACAKNLVVPGKMFVFETGLLTGPHYIINFPTKRHWRGGSRIEDIDAGLLALEQEIRARHIRSIAVPPLGAGLGGLPWPEIRKRIEQTALKLDDVHFVVFEPDPLMRERRHAASSDVPKMTSGRAALLVLIDTYLRGLLDPYITLLEVHKLLYFMQLAGQPLRLKYIRYHYGPYAENLRHVLHAIEGHYLRGYDDGGDAPDKEIEPIDGALKQAEQFLKDDIDTQQRVKRVAELVAGFETPFGLELLSTVHWVIVNNNPRNNEELVEKIYKWNNRKQQFLPFQITLAAETLAKGGWIDPPVSAIT